MDAIGRHRETWQFSVLELAIKRTRERGWLSVEDLRAIAEAVPGFWGWLARYLKIEPIRLGAALADRWVAPAIFERALRERLPALDWPAEDIEGSGWVTGNGAANPEPRGIRIYVGGEEIAAPDKITMEVA